MMYFVIGLIVAYLTLFSFHSLASPHPMTSSELGSRGLHRRADPVFPADPPSCPLCAQNYGSINSCAEAAPVLANFSEIIFNPGAFISVIQCACTDTFQSTFPQCVDCFEQTNQTDVLQTSNLPAVVDGMRKICALESTLLGGVATADGEVTPTSSIAVPTAVTTSGATLHAKMSTILLTAALLGLSASVW